MRITADEVLSAAQSAAIHVDAPRAATLATELTRCLEALAPLLAFDAAGVEPAVAVGAVGMPLRADESEPIAMREPAVALAPHARDGFIAVPYDPSSADGEVGAGPQA